MSEFSIAPLTDEQVKKLDKALDLLEKKLERKWKLSTCGMCSKKRKVETHRRLTQYNDDTKNWLTCCKDCIAQDNDHYKEMWADYYESQGFGGCYGI